MASLRRYFAINLLAAVIQPQDLPIPPPEEFACRMTSPSVQKRVRLAGLARDYIAVAVQRGHIIPS